MDKICKNCKHYFPLTEIITKGWCRVTNDGWWKRKREVQTCSKFKEKSQ